jgi:hypothetical protein
LATIEKSLLLYRLELECRKVEQRPNEMDFLEFYLLGYGLEVV